MGWILICIVSLSFGIWGFVIGGKTTDKVTSLMLYKLTLTNIKNIEFINIINAVNKTNIALSMNNLNPISTSRFSSYVTSNVFHAYPARSCT